MCFPLTLFALYINDLAQETKRANLGISTDSVNFITLLYADDIVVVAESLTYKRC